MPNPRAQPPSLVTNALTEISTACGKQLAELQESGDLIERIRKRQEMSSSPVDRIAANSGLGRVSTFAGPVAPLP